MPTDWRSRCTGARVTVRAASLTEREPARSPIALVVTTAVGPLSSERRTVYPLLLRGSWPWLSLRSMRPCWSLITSSEFSLRAASRPIFSASFFVSVTAYARSFPCLRTSQPSGLG